MDEQSHGFVARGSGWTLATEPPAAPWRPSPLRPDEGSATRGGTDILHAKGAAGRALRRRIGVDPFSSLNPLARVDTSISEPLKVHRLVDGAPARRDRVTELLDLVGQQYTRDMLAAVPPVRPRAAV